MSAMLRSLRPVSLAVLAAVIFGGCSASQMVNMWKDPVLPKAPIDNVLVIALAKEQANRRLWEDAVVEELQANGARGTQSYDLYPNAAPDTLQVAQAVQEHHYGGVIVMHRLGTRQVARLVPGYVTAAPYWYGSHCDYNHWGAYYHPYHAMVYSPGYIVTDREVRYQIDVWTSEDNGRLVWTGTTATINPSSAQQVRYEVSRLLVQELRAKDVVTGSGL